jgi:hypothetical protein
MTSEPERKKARTHHEDLSTENRVEELQDKILALKEEFPELACIDQRKLHSCLDSAITKYKSDQGRLENERHCPLYKLPNEILQKCFEYVGNKSYLFTAMVSKKFHDAFTSKFVSVFHKNSGKMTSYRYGACSTPLAKHCIETLCKTQSERDQIFIAGAVNGNIEILEYGREEGYDLLPIINRFGFEDIFFSERISERDLRYIQVEALVGYSDDGCSEESSGIARIAREGHLHVLKYLYEKVNFRMGMQLASYEAIRNGHLDIVEWLHSIDYLEELITVDEEGSERLRCFCDEYCPAEVLKWLIENGYYTEFNHTEFSSFYENVLKLADKDLLDCCLSKGVEFEEESINSLAYFGNVEFAKYCEEKGLMMTSDAYLNAGETGDLEMVKFLHKSGIPWNNDFTKTTRNFEILKFAHENGCPWHPKTSVHVNYGDLKMLKYLYYTSGCPWNPNAFQAFFHRGEKATVEVFRFMHKNDCPWDKSFSQIIIEMENISFLKYLHESGLPYESDLLALALTRQWLDGVQYIIESEMQCKRPKNFSQRIIETKNISLLKYLHESGLPYENKLLELALRKPWWLDGVKYIIESEMKCERPKIFSRRIIEMKNISLVRYLHKSGSPYENNLLELALKKQWFDGVKYIIESEMKCERPTDLGIVICSDRYKCHDIEILKYLKSIGMEWGTSYSVFEVIVSSDSDFKDRLEVFKWAIDSGCPLDEESEDLFYWAFHSWLEDPSNQQKRSILSYLQKQGVPQGNIFHECHDF